MKKLLVLALAVSTVMPTMVMKGYANASTQEGCSERSVRIIETADTTPLQTLTVKAKAPRDPHVGDTVRIPVVVTRPAEEDPLGQGVPLDPPKPEAAPGIDVSVGLMIGDVFLIGYGRTDERGKATVKIKIGKHVKPGAVDARLHAWKAHAQLPCLRLDENGHRVYGGFFSVRPTS